MMYTYEAITPQGTKTTGQIDAPNENAVLENLQSKGLIVVGVKLVKTTSNSTGFSLFNRVKLKDIVITSRQIASLFDAQVSAVRVFNLMAESSANPVLKYSLENVSRDIQAGITIAEAMRKHPKVFSDFYVNMVRAGEESGKLTDTFNFLADYLERQYELSSKTRNAMIYPAFVVATFFIVMILMMVLVIPKLTSIITESGGEIPIYTKIVIGISNLLLNYGFILVVFAVLFGLVVQWQLRQPAGKLFLDRMKLRIPYVGDLYTKMYLARIADNLSTMLTAGIPVVRTLEITQSVVGNRIFETILADAIVGVKGGTPISDMFAKSKHIPQVFVWMIRTGEETGTIGNMLKKIATYYKREVETSVDTLIGLIEPAMIVSLGLSVAFLLMSVLVPIYNIADSVG
jgi:type IV pilus assembly protein PilC